MVKFPTMIEFIDEIGLDELHAAHKQYMEDMEVEYKYNLVLEDPEGTHWAYEGSMDGHPIFVRQNKARAKALTEREAQQIVYEHASREDKVILERCVYFV